MGWRERDWAKFTDAEREALYGSRSAGWNAPAGYAPPARPGSRRSFLAPGAGIAIAVTAAVVLLGQFPRNNPILPALRFGSPGAVILAQPRTFPLNLSPTAVYGSILTVNGADPAAASGTVLALGQWNNGPWTTLASTSLASDHSWSISISIDQHGSLNIRINLPSGNSLVGAETVP